MIDFDRKVYAATLRQLVIRPKLLRILVPAAGVEPAAFRSGGERSNPLSYAGMNKIAGFNDPGA